MAPQQPTESLRQDLLARLRAGLENLERLKTEGVALRAELLVLDATLQEAEADLSRCRAELSSGATPARATELSTRVDDLTQVAQEVEAALRKHRIAARLELYEIETGIATDAALRIRTEAAEFAERLGDGR